MSHLLVAATRPIGRCTPHTPFESAWVVPTVESRYLAADQLLSSYLCDVSATPIRTHRQELSCVYLSLFQIRQRSNLVAHRSTLGRHDLHRRKTKRLEFGCDHVGIASNDDLDLVRPHVPRRSLRRLLGGHTTNRVPVPIEMVVR